MTETATQTQRAGGSLAAGEGAEREGESRALKGWMGSETKRRKGCGDQEWVQELHPEYSWGP